MFTSSEDHKTYTPLTSIDPTDTDDDGTTFKSHERNNKLKACFFKCYFSFLHLIILILIVFLFQTSRKAKYAQSHFMLESEIPWGRDYVQYEEVIFAPSGFTEDGNPATLYEGASTPETDARWSELIDVGMYSLTREEYDQLPITTAEIIGREDEYLVTLEVFHQIHCVNYLRLHVYNNSNPLESEASKTKHLSHCIDYLRQVLMCHGDMSLITLHPEPHRQPPYMPDFNIRHTCRNFDKIREFATLRNTSGVSIE